MSYEGTKISPSRLPAATGSALGAVITGSNITNTAGTISLTNGNVTAALGYTPVNKAGDTMTGLLILSGNAVDPLGAVTKQQIEGLLQGLDTKASVRVATTANITLSAPQTIDGVAVVAGDRVLVKDQSTASANGIYVVAAGAWTRATDADASDEVTAGMYTFVSEGTTNADTGWVLSTDDVVTLGTTSLTFTQFSGAGQITVNGTSALTKTGNALSVNVDNSSIEIATNALQVKALGITAAMLAGSIPDTKLSTISTAGKVADTALSSNIARRDQGNSWQATNIFGAPGIDQPVRIVRDAGAGDSTNTLSVYLGNSGTNEGGLLFLWENAAANGSPKASFSFQPRDNADTTNINPANLVFAKTPGADTGSITLSNTNGSLALQASGVIVASSSMTVGGGVSITTGGLAVAAGPVTLPAGTTASASITLPHGVAPTTPTNGDVWTTTAGLFARINGATIQFGAGSGTVTSVALTVPSFLSVAGSPVTSSGTLAVTLATQSANTVFAGPVSGAAAAPTFRALVPADTPRTVRVVTAAGAVTVTVTDDLVVVNKTTGAATAVTLPATPATGAHYTIKDGKGDASTNSITVSPAVGTIDGAATAVIDQDYGARVFVYNGTQWNVL